MPKTYDLDPPLRVFEPPTPTCYSCGKPAAVVALENLCCGRCAYLLVQDTLGTVASVILHLGAA